MKNIIILFLLMLNFLSFSYAEQDLEQGSPDIEISVSGMVCDFCAQGLKKTFGKKEAVKKIDVSLEKGIIYIWLKESKSLGEEEINQAIINNGISVKDIKKNSK